MSRNLSSRHASFSEPGIATMPPRAPRLSRPQLAAQAVITEIREQKAAVQIDGVVMLYTAMRPSEQKIAERAIRNQSYGRRRTPSGMTVYTVHKPEPEAPVLTRRPADQPKPKLSKRQRALAEIEMLKQFAEVVAAKQPTAKQGRPSRHERQAKAQ